MSLIQKPETLKNLITISFLLTCRICVSQNLVPNGDFEQYTSCPSAPGQIYLAPNWSNPANLNFNSSPDYLNQCATSSLFSVPGSVFGFQQAHSGVAYSGIIVYGMIGLPNFREYIEVLLSSSLAANTCYHFEMYINAGETYGGYTTDDIGVYFSDTLITGISNSLPLQFQPQIVNPIGNYPDTVNWILSAGDFTAAGGEQYLLIGNFKNDANSNALLINSNNIYNSTYLFIDDISLTPCVGINELKGNDEIELYPNPIIDNLNIIANNNESLEITIYEFTSRKVLECKFSKFTSINTSHLAKGIYLYEAKNKNEIIAKGKLLKD